jgi:hypothetical protein
MIEIVEMLVVTEQHGVKGRLQTMNPGDTVSLQL